MYICGIPCLSLPGVLSLPLFSSFLSGRCLLLGFASPPSRFPFTANYLPYSYCVRRVPTYLSPRLSMLRSASGRGLVLVELKFVFALRARLNIFAWLSLRSDFVSLVVGSCLCRHWVVFVAARMQTL